ncbi:VOC family protein [Mucilaginibacter arboris]|uniref:VOC family protein n=1 Tax=Mucilaginibacter arboris TaxID=2682090 RepID=A0A7K1SWG1_9SPHI|nr:VOC family protein [Mucilaginibacter arboris]MVN21669.1 VOC family protein [Mucilaginibacter arboris]
MKDKSRIPEGYQRIIPYLIIHNALDFFNFTKNVFDAEEKYRQMRDEKVLMHGEVNIGGNYIMFADATEGHPAQNAGMFIYVDDCDEVYKKALVNEASSIMEPSDQSYGRSAGVKDSFGNTWWITTGI